MAERAVDSRTLVCLFAKAPVAGRVKTRMQPVLDARQCQALHRELIRHAVTRLSVLSDGDFAVELHITAAHPFFDQLAGEFGLPLRLQRGEDLGQRMAHAVSDGLERFGSVILVGADWPFLTQTRLRAARDALASAPAVIVPASDGGYVLLGLNRFDPRVFEGQRWGGDSVAADTRARFRALEWRCVCLESSADIDTPADLALLGALPDLADWAQETGRPSKNRQDI